MDFNLFIPASTRVVYLYQKPISMRWGPNKLAQICVEEMGIEPKDGLAFLFFNKSKDTLMAFFKDDTEDQIIMKKLDRGGFMAPVGEPGERFVKLSSSMLPKLFRLM